MSKYDWYNVPKEVKWIAADADGWQTRHSAKPSIKGDVWLDCTCSGYLSIFRPSKNEYKGCWQYSLEEHPNVD